MGKKISTKHGAKATGEKWRDDYKTPHYILKLVDSFYGHCLWFDPAPAHRYPNYNGLENAWGDQCFVNPPFSNYLAWVKKGIYEYQISNAQEQIWIMHHDSSTERFKALYELSDAICLLNKRVEFIDPRIDKPNGCDIAKSQTLVYIGTNPLKFADVFGSIGMVLFSKGMPRFTARDGE